MSQDGPQTQLREQLDPELPLFLEASASASSPHAFSR